MESTIGERIRRARKLHTLSQPELAKLVGCSVDRIKQFEKIGTPSHPEPPKGSRYFDAVLLRLEINLDGSPTAEVDPDDPPVSMATKQQLVSALARLIYAESPQGEEVSNVEPFTLRGMALRHTAEPRDDENRA